MWEQNSRRRKSFGTGGQALTVYRLMEKIQQAEVKKIYQNTDKLNFDKM